MSKQPALKIGFDPVIRELFQDPTERFEFWDSPSTIEWFCSHGYILYERVIEERGVIPYGTAPVSSTVNLFEDTYPYSYHDTEDYEDGVAKLHVEEYKGKVIFAQDSQQRHVAIKLVPTGSDEERILRFLSEQSLDTLKENCVLPVLDFLPAEGFWLVVMPRWGDGMYHPPVRTYREMLHIIRSLLKAVTFIHRHNIVHRDIKFDNVLINHFGDSRNVDANTVRRDMRHKGILSYALFDFDLATMLPSEIDNRKCRHPYQISFWGSYNQPKDVQQGEFDYDPFAFDVGCLGVEFCYYWQTYAKDLPMLAPLLDRMTTRDVPSRFTAAEALQFFEERYSELTESTLNQFVRGLPDTYERLPYDEFDRWEHVPPEFAAKWAAFREPPIPLTTRVLRYLVTSGWFPRYTVPGIRWLFFELSSSPRRLLTYFVGLGARKLGMTGKHYNAYMQ